MENYNRISPKLLESLICPISGGELTYDRNRDDVLISKKAGVAFPIIDGIPILLESEAMEIEL